MAQLHPSPLARATPFPLDRADVAGCLDAKERPTDALFETAFKHSLKALDPASRTGALSGITGHVAESLVEVILQGLDWIPVWHFVGPGRHGVDLLLLGPGAERMFVVEVKGTLRPGCWPRLAVGDLTQMDVAWLDKSDNPAMSEWGLESADVYGGIVLVNFPDLLYKIALTGDFVSWHPIESLGQLADLAWLDRPTTRRLRRPVAQSKPSSADTDQAAV